MTLALGQAELSMYITAPNPRVGCVIVKDGRIIGRGHTQPPGGNHAEIEAMRDAAAQGHDVRGATVYVTLEPCSHFGRTPPCADALIKAGVGRVVAAIGDPNPLVAGQGMARLAAAGIAVESGLMEDAAHEINIGFFSRMRHGKPWIRMKTAASLDGKTALHSGASQWITSQEARDDGHAWRARACAILTGIGTVLQDDPQLNVRAVATPRQPRRIIIDSHLSITPQAKIMAGGGSWIFTAIDIPSKRQVLEAEGNEVIVLPNRDGKVDLPAVIAELGKRQINEVHVEAGAKLNASLIAEGCVDELLLYLAPSLIGDARDMFALPALPSLERQIRLKFHDVRQIGPDLRILARF
ncbi:bifunctional diaminohydroxyphosphoribosylaminopyrimidine deaminase/5-amino-6-(5-phosphoribosylamino)uracil reductase RibD [Oxalobacteraceae bacterium CAVE-383]|nr:bifunctional diaminohydroxyphosphoribosylaminopyrimidine deaminase/5-amino-6-(5-phosphoribosylamino)uracil reductase RibD [Oxalobacteraceae bacterium CAVE-383]